MIHNELPRFAGSFLYPSGSSKRKHFSNPIVARAVLLLVLATLLLPASDYYKLRGVKRIDQDLYKSLDGVFVETQYCYHYTYGEEAVLRWEGPNRVENKIIWADDSTCRVNKAWKK